VRRLPRSRSTSSRPEVGLFSAVLSELLFTFALCWVVLNVATTQRRPAPCDEPGRLDVNQDLFAFDVANAATGMSGEFAVGLRASRTAATDRMGAHSQIPDLVAGLIVALVLLFFDVLALLPNAALAGIGDDAVVGLIEVGEFREL
jgi:MFS superfamily sulfate permease-like transporter